MTNRNGFGQFFEDLEFADDVTLIIEKIVHMQYKIDLIRQNTQKTGLEISST